MHQYDDPSPYTHRFIVLIYIFQFQKDRTKCKFREEVNGRTITLALDDLATMRSITKTATAATHLEFIPHSARRKRKSEIQGGLTKVRMATVETESYQTGSSYDTLLKKPALVAKFVNNRNFFDHLVGHNGSINLLTHHTIFFMCVKPSSLRTIRTIRTLMLGHVSVNC